GNMHQTLKAGRTGQGAQTRRKFGVNFAETLAPTSLCQNADQVDGILAALQRGADTVVVLNVAYYRHNLSDHARRTKEIRRCRATCSDLHAETTIAQHIHHIAAYKARAAKNRHLRRRHNIILAESVKIG